MIVYRLTRNCVTPQRALVVNETPTQFRVREWWGKELLSRESVWDKDEAFTSVSEASEALINHAKNEIEIWKLLMKDLECNLGIAKAWAEREAEELKKIQLAPADEKG